MPETQNYKLGDFVVFDGLPAVVVGLPDVAGVETPDVHVALWFGTPQVERVSRGGPGNPRPEVWTVPAEYCEVCAAPEVKH